MSTERELFSSAYDSFTKADYAKALEKFQLLESRGQTLPCAYLGYMFEHGLGVQEDANVALDYYRKGAVAKDALARTYLSNLLRSQGKLTEAVKLYEEPEQFDNPSANYWLYVFYNNGRGVDKDISKSYYYLRKAADLGHLYAVRDLSKLQMRGVFGIGMIIPGIIAFLFGIVKFAFVLANDKHSERLF